MIPNPMMEAQRKEMKRGPLLATLAVLGVLLLGILMLMPMFGRPNYEVGLYDAIRPNARIAVKGVMWPMGERKIQPDRAMIAVGRTDEGHLLYVNVHHNYGGGGGGGAPETSSGLAQYQELFVRNGTNTYTRVK